MNTTQRTRRAAMPLREANTVELRAPTMIDIVVRMLDKITGDLIRHIPTEELPEVASILVETHGGLIEEMA